MCLRSCQRCGLKNSKVTLKQKKRHTEDLTIDIEIQFGPKCQNYPFDNDFHIFKNTVSP